MSFLHILVLFIIIILVINWLVKSITVFEYERGLKYINGKFVAILEPGKYWFLNLFTTITKIDIRPKFVSITGQEILSSDGVTLKISLAANFSVSDPYKAINNVEKYQEALYLILQMALRAIIGKTRIDELLEKRNEFGEKLMYLTKENIEELGLKLHLVDIKDIMFPGELKKMFSQAVKAQKEGMAALERARGETASLRHLANAAKMLENNPTLMQLRVLQSVNDSTGNTFVLGLTPTMTPLPIKEKEVREVLEGDKTPVIENSEE